MPGTARIDVVGLGPAGPDLITAATLGRPRRGRRVFLRTARHPAADAVAGARTFDHHYESADTFEDVYRAIVDDLVDAGRRPRVPWSTPCPGRPRWPSAPWSCWPRTRGWWPAR